MNLVTPLTELNKKIFATRNPSNQLTVQHNKIFLAMTKNKENTMHFRIDTPQFFKELTENTLSTGKNGILKVPLNVFMNLLSQVADRATQLQDPILDRLMFDLNLYELPSPTSKEYDKLMKQVYAAAKKQTELEKKNPKN